MKEERDRLLFERALWDQGYSSVLGLDEVGRGCLAGPVVAAGVILPNTVHHEKLRDSKSLSAKERTYMTEWVKDHAIAFTVFSHPPAIIDELNILQASLDAMKQCVHQIDHAVDFLLIDGNRAFKTSVPHQCIIKGDDGSASIAAASILAKTSRDTYMQALHDDYPMYHWQKNVGYPTKAHYEALNHYGFTEHHRQSFNLQTQKRYTP